MSHHRITKKGQQGNIIVLEGGIAVGKSTLAAALKLYLTKAGFSVVMLVEPLDKEFLALYQSDKDRYAFPFQCVMARERCQVYQEALRAAAGGYIVIMDRSLVGDVAFATMFNAKGKFTEREWKTYNSLIGLLDDQGNFKQIDAHFMPEASILYFDATPDEAFRRMLKRGDENERRSYTPEYFEDLHNAYEQAISGCSNYTRLDWNTVREIDDAVCAEVIGRVPELQHLAEIKLF